MPIFAPGPYKKPQRRNPPLVDGSNLNHNQTLSTPADQNTNNNTPKVS